MIPEGNLQSNVDRFNGFADDYDQHRPEAPSLVVEIISRYLERKVELVADIGCGTGLSTFIWKDVACQIVGIEPNPDMRGKAQRKLETAGATTADTISFKSGFSNNLPFEDGTVDVITCSQSFHWMDPDSTLREAGRVLAQGGIFAAFDCDWPPVLQWEIDQAYVQLITKADEILNREAPVEQQAHKWSKEQHLPNLQRSGQFRYTREIVFHNREQCDAARYIGLVLSQGGIQTLFKLGNRALDEDLARFVKLVKDHFQDRTLDILFSYRMRLGVK
ncbi:SAM-dependent methyltransferase [Paenibacillus terrae]|uniref:SAM-dependent methyltransferase n=1 Tax=Paenibacillus terrae TaxID=159743 RepID=A0A4U2PZS0_9BACL|nr:class I SAM-dependent methyltransferase [Paenibacillus terrae]TKH45215.1 SAM-dependent methyltransferase [Paenibacillus terrae]